MQRFQIGAVAQLGERMTGSHEARGSIPLSSTKFNNIRGGQGIFINTLPPLIISYTGKITRFLRTFYNHYSRFDPKPS